MFLTKECDYGIRVIRALADGSKKTVQTISKEENIPYKFAFKIFKKLEIASFVKSIRGRNGGYILDKPLDTFSLLDIVVAIDAGRFINDCMREDFTCAFKNHPDRPCQVHIELGRVQSLLMSELSAKTMDEVLIRKED